MFGNIACVQFCAAVDSVAVALDDDRELHCFAAPSPHFASGVCVRAPANGAPLERIP